VLGGNEASLRSVEIEYALDLLEPYPGQGSLVIAGGLGALMHPKTYYLERATGVRSAAVGSANLTGPGLAANVEAVLAVDSDSDPTAPFDDIKAAIEVWRDGSRPSATLVERDGIERLIADGVLDAPRPARPPLSKKQRKRLRRRLPPWAPIIKLPRRAALRRNATRRVHTPLRLGPSVQAMPAGAIGIVKRQSNQDTKGFRGEGGTPYISMPMALIPYLPMQPYGLNNEPRIDLSIEARADARLDQVISSGVQTGNITFVGGGDQSSSNKDLRFNIPKAVFEGLRSVISTEGGVIPGAGDPVAIEFVPDVGLVRLTFATSGALRTGLLNQCTEFSGRWGWLSSADAPVW
jgi:hypothetical protein